MLENSSEISYREGYRINLHEIDDCATEYSNSSKSPLMAGINGITNTSEEMINRIEPFLLEEKNDSSAKTGRLKNLLVGGVMLIGGTAALAAGCYFFYIAGKTGACSGVGSEKRVFPKLASTSAIADDFVRKLSDTRANDRFAVAGSTRSRSPYSYYKDLYGNAVTRNGVRQLPPVTESSVSAYMTEKTISITSNPKISEEFFATARQKKEPGIDNETIINDTYYPLDSKFKKDLASFCLSGIYSNVIKSNRADPKYRFELLSRIVDKIHYYREVDAVQREINSRRKDELAIEEKTNETLIRRKLTTLYLAAETIINKKDTLQFYINAMKDDRNYTADELSKRDANIMSYFSAHQPLGEC